MHLDDFITYLEQETRDIDAELNDMHVVEWKKPVGKNLLHELELFRAALTLAYGYRKTNGGTLSMPNREGALLPRF